jgi:hypothetical protein
MVQIVPRIAGLNFFGRGWNAGYEETESQAFLSHRTVSTLWLT